LSVSLRNVPMRQGLLFLSVVRIGKVRTPMVPLVTNNNSWLKMVPFIFKVFLTEGGVPLARVL
jgi:hypothetical protein